MWPEKRERSVGTMRVGITVKKRIEGKKRRVAAEYASDQSEKA